MAAIVLREFKGIAPTVNPRLLPDGAAVTAINTRLADHTIRTWRGPTPVATLTKPGVKKTIYRFGEDVASESSYWFSFTEDVDIVRAPIDGDATERTYYTGDGSYPKVTNNVQALTGVSGEYPIAWSRLGLPAPDISLTTVSVSGTADDPNSTANVTAYVITYVSSQGEESYPSYPSTIVTWRAGQQVDFTGLPGHPGGNYDVATKRIYRSSTGATGTTYQFVVELAVGTASYTDTKTQAQLGEVVATWGWEPPPADLKGLILMANGIGMGFVDKTLYPSEPYALYAYPPAYRLSVDSKIVGLAPFGQSCFVGTQSHPWVVTGVDPRNFTIDKLDENQALASKRGLVSMKGGVVYPSPDGLWYVGPGGMRCLTAGILERRHWQTYNPSSMHAYEIDGNYIAFFDTGARRGALVFEFDTGMLSELDQWCDTAYNDPIRDRLYMATDPTAIQSFNTNLNALQYKWVSKIYRAPDTVDLSYGKVEAESYPLLLTILGKGGTNLGQYQVNSDQPFRVAPMREREFQVQVDGNVNVSAVCLAETAREIMLA